MIAIDKFRKIAAGCRIREVFIVLLVIGWIGTMLWKDWLYKQETLVCVVNGATSYIGYADPLAEDKEYHVFLVDLALDAIFSRNPDGYSKWEYATRILNTNVQNSLLKDLKDNQTEAQAFRSMKITQSFVRSQAIEEVKIDSNASTMMIRGNIIRNLIRNGEPTVESQPTRVIIRLQRNPKWEIKGRQAMTVTQLEVDPV